MADKKLSEFVKVAPLLNEPTMASNSSAHGSVQSAIKTYVDAEGWKKIAETTVGVGGAATIDFTSIPATFTHLKLIGNVRGENATFSDFPLVRVNNDSVNNYSWLYHISSGNTAMGNPVGTVATNSIRLGLVEADNASADSFGIFLVLIANYANTNMNKETLSQAFDTSDNNAIRLHLTHDGGLWDSPAAINRITFFLSAADIAEFSKVSLYGIK